jgi:chemotaxis protein MotB
MDSVALFDTGSAALKSDTIGAMVNALRTIAASPYKIDVEGHTDDTPLYKVEKTDSGTEIETNWSLSGRRASAVALLLRKIGVRDQRLRVVGYADTQPKETVRGKKGQALDAARQKNRRVSLLLHSKDTASATGGNP